MPSVQTHRCTKLEKGALKPAASLKRHTHKPAVRRTALERPFASQAFWRSADSVPTLF